jgi:hypothetical protein
VDPSASTLEDEAPSTSADEDVLVLFTAEDEVPAKAPALRWYSMAADRQPARALAHPWLTPGLSSSRLRMVSEMTSSRVAKALPPVASTNPPELE